MSRFLLALVKALGENHPPDHHFGSLGGFSAYLAEAREMGLVAGDPPELTLEGMRLYLDRGLDRLPNSRAVEWRIGDTP